MCLLFVSFTVSPSSSQLLESSKKREELEKQLKESNEEKRLLLEEIAQLKQDMLAARAQGDHAHDEALRMIQGTAQGDNGLLVWPSSTGGLDGSVKQVGAALLSAAGFLFSVTAGWRPVPAVAGSGAMAGFLGERFGGEG